MVTCWDNVQLDAVMKGRQEVREVRRKAGLSLSRLSLTRLSLGNQGEVKPAQLVRLCHPRFWHRWVMIVRLCVTPRLPLTDVSPWLSRLWWSVSPHPRLHRCLRHPPSLLSPVSPSSSTRGLSCGLATSCCYSR